MSIIGEPFIVMDSIITLPNEYDRAAYISSSVSSSSELEANIDLGYIPSLKSKIWIKYMAATVSSGSTWGWMLSCANFAGFNLQRKEDTQILQLRSYDQHYKDIENGLATGLRTVYIDLQNRRYVGSGVINENVLIDEDDIMFDHLIVRVRSSFSPCEIKIFESGILSSHYVACRRKSDSVIGMYELKTGIFYTKNSGNGTLVFVPYVE